MVVVTPIYLNTHYCLGPAPIQRSYKSVLVRVGLLLTKIWERLTTAVTFTFFENCCEHTEIQISTDNTHIYIQEKNITLIWTNHRHYRHGYVHKMPHNPIPTNNTQ